MSEIVLINAALKLAEIVGRKVSNDQTSEMLFTRGFTFYTIGKGKGSRVMVTEEVAATLHEQDWNISTRRKRTAVELPTVEQEARETIIERLDPQWKAEIEEMVLESDGRVDALHKAVKAMHDAYVQLYANVDKKANLPEPPALPPRYRYKVVVIGGDRKIVEHLERVFRDTKFLHIGSGGSHTRMKLSQAYPQGDLIILMKSFCSHSLADIARVHYGTENIQMVGGSASSAESVVHLWLNERRMQEEARV